MKCVNHPDVDAVGICNSCGKYYCRECLTSLRGEVYCPQCLQQQKEAPSSYKKVPILASICSLFLGGAGQVYNGQVGKGLLIFFTSWLIIPWIYGIIDAYITADKINKGIIIVPERMGCMVAAMIFMILMPIVIVIMAIAAAIIIPMAMQ